MVAKQIILWDMDSTLGEFRKIHYALRKECHPGFNEPATLRFGIEGVLQRFSEQGFAHVVVTRCESTLAEKVLKTAGIRDYFAKVYEDWGILTSVYSKAYKFILSRFGLSEQEMKSNAIVTGDWPTDRSGDVDGLVFLQHLCGDLYDSFLVEIIFNELLKRGSGDFGRGFAAMHASAAENHEGERVLTFPQGVSLSLSYQKNPPQQHIGYITVPEIKVIDAEAFRREPTIIRF